MTRAAVARARREPTIPSPTHAADTHTASHRVARAPLAGFVGTTRTYVPWLVIPTAHKRLDRRMTESIRRIKWPFGHSLFRLYVRDDESKSSLLIVDWDSSMNNSFVSYDSDFVSDGSIPTNSYRARVREKPKRTGPSVGGGSTSGDVTQLYLTSCTFRTRVWKGRNNQNKHAHTHTHAHTRTHTHTHIHSRTHMYTHSGTSDGWSTSSRRRRRRSVSSSRRCPRRVVIAMTTPSYHVASSNEKHSWREGVPSPLPAAARGASSSCDGVVQPWRVVCCCRLSRRHTGRGGGGGGAGLPSRRRRASQRASRSERESERACSGGGVVWRRRPAIDRPPSSWTTSWIIITTQVFAALELCPLSAARVVIVGQDPYHAPGQVMTQIVSSIM